MNYQYDNNSDRSTCCYQVNPPSYNRPILITIGKQDKYWKQAFCHEIAHALSTKYKTKLVRDDTPYETMKHELLAWRLAKSFCKAKYWNEKEAISCLRGYAISLCYKIDISKLKIIPLNTNHFLMNELRRKHD